MVPRAPGVTALALAVLLILLVLLTRTDHVPKRFELADRVVAFSSNADDCAPGWMSSSAGLALR